MRIVAVLILATVMYFAVPYLWTRAMVAEMNRVAADGSGIPEMNATIATNLSFDTNVVNAINPTVTINTEEYEALGVQSRADDAMRQAQRASDQAYDATH